MNQRQSSRVDLPGRAPPAPAVAKGLLTAPRSKPATSAPIDDLRRTAVAGVLLRVELMFAEAPRELLKLADKAAGDVARRRPLDLIRTLDLERPRLLRGFGRELERSFRPLPGSVAGIDVDRDRLAGTPGEEVEEQQALNQLAARSQRLAPGSVLMLRDRLQHAARALAAEVSPRALSPLSLCECWRATLQAADVPFEDRLLAHQLFDKYVLQRLAPVFEEALQVLDRHGWSAVTAPVTLIVDGRTVECLERAAADMDVPSEAALARRLLEAVRLPESRGATALTQRLALVGQMINEILADPQLPTGFAPLFEPLRFALIKAALADANFFVLPAHPLRQRLAHAAEQGVCARLGGPLALRHMETLLLSLPVQTDIAAGFVGPELGELPLLLPTDITRFTEAQRELTAARREALLARVRRIVAQELAVQSLGLHVPAPARALVQGGLGPLLAVRLLRFGVDHRMWHDAVDRLGQVLHSLEPRAGAPDLNVRRELTTALRADLGDVGLASARIDSLIAGLERAWAEAERAPPAAAEPVVAARVVAEPVTMQSLVAAEAAPVPTPAAAPPLEHLLRSVLQTDAWFRVHRGADEEPLWLRLQCFDPQRDEARFCGYDGSKSFRLSARALAEDLRAGRTEPINPSPSMHVALAELRRA